MRGDSLGSPCCAGVATGRRRVRSTRWSLDAFRTAELDLEGLMASAPDMDAPINRHLVNGEAGTVVPEILGTLSPGVVVMGTLARAGLKGVFFGNTAERVLGSIDVPVLAVKPPGFETPVAV